MGKHPFVILHAFENYCIKAEQVNTKQAETNLLQNLSGFLQKQNATRTGFFNGRYMNQAD